VPSTRLFTVTRTALFTLWARTADSCEETVAFIQAM
jgi:hypothetical protein